MSKTVLIRGLGSQGLGPVVESPALQRVVEKWPLLADCHSIPCGTGSFDVRFHPNGGIVVVFHEGGQNEEKG